MRAAPRILAAAVAATVCVGMMLFQLALVSGAPMGRWAWGGGEDVLPPSLRIGSLISAAIFLFGAVVVLERSGMLAGFRRPRLASAGTWVLAVLFFFSGILNLFQAGPEEKVIMVPVAFLLSILFLWVALGPSNLELRDRGAIDDPVPEKETP